MERTTMDAKKICRACGGAVQKNYDHVGDCRSGRCSGTYAHVRSSSSSCYLAARDIGHDRVKDGTGSTR